MDGALNSSQVQVANGSCETDFKVLVSPAQLFDIIGEASYDAILQALECSVPDAIVLRRTVATGRFIGELRSTKITPPVTCKCHKITNRLVSVGTFCSRALTAS